MGNTQSSNIKQVVHIITTMF